jgi:hypothetical protein
MAKFTVTFKVNTDFHYQLKGDGSKRFSDAEVLEIELKDLIKTSVLPALDLELVPLTFTVKKARN